MIDGVAYRTPACDQHLKDNESDECPWCEIEQLDKQIFGLWRALKRIRHITTDDAVLDVANRALETQR